MALFNRVIGHAPMHALPAPSLGAHKLNWRGPSSPVALRFYGFLTNYHAYEQCFFHDDERFGNVPSRVHDRRSQRRD